MSEHIAIESLLQQYVPIPGTFNELFTADNTPRADWQSFFHALQRLGRGELQHRNIDIGRLLRENGVAYTIYNDPDGQARPWKLDPIPQLITPSEWETINKGLVQRAQLFNLLLQDIYGPQTVIRNGIVPQELIYLHPGFLRQCVNIALPPTAQMPFYAADLARGNDGRHWIISDRTQAPSGSGYALENRFAITSALPELFTTLQVRRLSSYFDTLQTTLTKIAPRNNDNPRIVILTPGPVNETYFEHSYLAAYLGLTLVQGNDLMVKDNCVWLKTIEGLEKIDVIVRRVDDAYCDPLELRTDSLLGVPGLLQAVRKGNVTIANPLGSSILENAGLVPFLPAIARHLLGEELVMPTIATWWCGQPKECNYVVDNISSLVIRKIFRNSAGQHSTIDGASLSNAAKQELVRMIQSTPHLYVGQEKINFASTPAWVNDNVIAGQSLFRSFLVSHDQTYLAMPGGLTRTAAAGDSFIISNQLGGISKDTWVLSDDAYQERPVNLQLQQDHAAQKVQKRSLPSHTAENLFWVGRYTERVIHNARLHRAVLQRVLETGMARGIHESETTVTLLKALTRCTYTYPGFEDDDGSRRERLLTNPWPELADLLYNQERNGSLTHNLLLLKNAVYSVRNFWSLDTWRVLQQLEENWTTARTEVMQETDHLRMIASIDALNTSMFAFLGMNRESVRREQGWNIMDVGRKLEQSLYLINLLRNVFLVKQPGPIEHELLESVMIAGQSLITYRYTYRDHLQLPLALELLMLDANYPKSLAYLVKKIRRYIGLLPGEGKDLPHSSQRRNIQEAASMLALADIFQLSTADPADGTYVNLHRFLDKMTGLLSEASLSISKTYFKHSQPQKQLYTANLI